MCTYTRDQGAAISQNILQLEADDENEIGALKVYVCYDQNTTAVNNQSFRVKQFVFYAPWCPDTVCPAYFASISAIPNFVELFREVCRILQHISSTQKHF